jgi:hypothetical protein
MFLYLVVYKNEKGKIFYRLRKTLDNLEIGIKTSMQWEVIDIQKFYKKRFYKLSTYNEKMLEETKKYNLNKDRKRKVKKIIEILHNTFK